MKTLSTEQQEQLQLFVAKAMDDLSSTELVNEAAFWATELKPKRVRKKSVEITFNDKVLDTELNT